MSGEQLWDDGLTKQEAMETLEQTGGDVAASAPDSPQPESQSNDASGVISAYDDAANLGIPVERYLEG